MSTYWQRREFFFLILYAIIFYCYVIRRSLQLSNVYHDHIYGLRPGWIGNRLNDVSDPQWRNFRGNLPILTITLGSFTLLVNLARSVFHLKPRGVSNAWLIISLAYLSYLHGTCIIFMFSIAALNFILIKLFLSTNLVLIVLWCFNIGILVLNRVFEGYSFSAIGERWAHLDNHRGVFRWHICFNFVVLRMISYGYDFYRAHSEYKDSHFDEKKHILDCLTCRAGETCYQLLQEKTVDESRFSFNFYLSYLVYPPLYIAGPIISFNAFVTQLATPQTSCSFIKVLCYALRWVCNFVLMELITHFLYYNGFMLSALWEKLHPIDVFIIGYGVLNFMWLKFLLIWRYFRFWSLVNGVEPPENMPNCINNCYNLEGFWRSWHASFNIWLVRYIYIPLGGSKRKIANVWVVFTFVAIWHDLEWKLLSWAWLTSLFFVPEIIFKATMLKLRAGNPCASMLFRELNALAGAVTIFCLMVANLLGYVVGPSGIKYLIYRFLHKDGLFVLGFLFLSFYIATKIMLNIQSAKKQSM